LSEEQLHQISTFVKQHLHETVSSSDQEWVKRFPRAAEHRWQHSLNVVQNAEKIIAGDGISQDVSYAAQAASIMHDVSTFECDHAVHGQVGAETAEKYLSEQQHDPDFIARVVRAIAEHGTDFDTLSPQEMGEQFSLEGKILIEADILDKLGVAAVSNAMLMLGKQERLGHECHALLSDSDAMKRAVYFKDYVWSETGRRMAGERFAFFLKFMDQLADEVVTGTE